VGRHKPAEEVSLMGRYMFKYGVAKSLCNGDVFQALRGNSIPSYLAYTLDGRNTIRDLISTVVWHYIPLRTCKRLRMALKRSLRKKHQPRHKKLEKYGFPVPI